METQFLIRAQVAAGMIAVTALGLAQVAMISKQQFWGASSNHHHWCWLAFGIWRRSTSSRLQYSRCFQTNQIAEAIQGRLQTPIKAYVVSKDVSTAQEMDRNIVGTASLG